MAGIKAKRQSVCHQPSFSLTIITGHQPSINHGQSPNSIDSTINSHDQPAIVISQHQELSLTGSNYDPPAFTTMTHLDYDQPSPLIVMCHYVLPTIYFHQPWLFVTDQQDHQPWSKLIISDQLRRTVLIYHRPP